MSANDDRIIEELKKIRVLLEPKPAPPAAAPVKKTFSQEFMDFLNKYGILGLAIGFIIGGAASSLVGALVNDIIMPVITFFIPKGEWQTATLVLGPIVLSVGHFIGVLLNFLVIALIVFLLMKPISKMPLK